MFTVKAIMGHADLEELAGYVQRTPEARAKLLASQGEHNALTVIDGVGRLVGLTATTRRSRMLRATMEQTYPDQRIQF